MPPSSSLCRRGTPYPMCREVCQPAIEPRSQLHNNKNKREEMREYFFKYMVEYDALTWTKYARIFYYHDFWHTLSFCPNTTTLYLTISCEGELRNGTKYTELAYLFLISGNSGVQKCMALLLSDKVCQLTCTGILWFVSSCDSYVSSKKINLVTVS